MTRKGSAVTQIYFCTKTRSRRRREVPRFFKLSLKRLTGRSTVFPRGVTWTSTAYPR